MRYNGPTAAVRDQFHQGTNRRAYEMLGAHPVTQDGQEMWHFAVWAPNARAVSLIGEFNQWDRKKTPMQKVYDGTWEVRLPAKTFDVKSDPKRYDYPDAAKKLTTYKYCIQAQDGTWQDKADPYGFAMQMRPDTASRIYDLSGYRWGDADWMEARKSYDPYHSPVNIYEMHLGSWRRHKDGTFLTYTEIAEQLVPYLKEMGYTHVEFMPVMEHPLDMSWGYQVSGYYAATARFGEPKELMALIDALHQAGIGVLLDWVPAHFPRDAMGLRRFDGTPCYEHPDPRRGDMPQWGTHMFDYARGEVNSFMLSNACFWLEWYHADGLRVDAVTSMLMYDFCREPGQWLPNKYGGHENLDAIAFLRRMNETVYRDFPGVMMVAEESSAYPMVTRPIYLGGLGFGFKWNMGWMNDMLAYIKLDPVYRKYHHDKLTFSLMYAFSENYILPFSHDEVVHGKHSMLDKQPGDLWKKFAGLRALYGYTMAHPGKKLLFMGGEFGQFIEWNYDDSLDWHLPQQYPMHKKMLEYSRALNKFYCDHKALWQVDFDWNGFQWIDCNDNENSVVSFIRKAEDPSDYIVAVCNFTPEVRHDYRIGVPEKGSYIEVFNSDDEAFGGSGVKNEGEIKTEDVKWHDRDQSILLTIPPMATIYLRHKGQVASGRNSFDEAPAELEVRGHEEKSSADKAEAAEAMPKKTVKRRTAAKKVEPSEGAPADKPKRRGRPRMTEEEKAAAKAKREAEKAAKAAAEGEAAPKKARRRRSTAAKTTAKKTTRKTTAKKTASKTAKAAAGES